LFELARAVNVTAVPLSVRVQLVGSDGSLAADTGNATLAGGHVLTTESVAVPEGAFYA